jgi:hypothetical protein
MHMHTPQAIGLMHMLFDMLAFKSDVGFWKGQDNLNGFQP